MKKTCAKIFTIILLISFVTSPVIAQSPAFIRIAHLAPFAADTSVTISLNGEVILSGFEYGDSTAYIEVLSGEHTIAVTPTGATTPAIEETVSIDPQTYYTFLAIGDGDNQALALKQLEDDIAAAAPDKFKLRLGHLAPFADTLAGTMVDVRTDDDIVIWDNVEFGEVDDVYRELDPGPYDLKITTPDGSTTLIDLAPVSFKSGQIFSVFAVGKDTFLHPLGGYVLPKNALGYFLPLEGAARLRIAHLAPFDDPGTVEITVNGEPALSDFDYGDSTVYFELPEDNYLVEVFPGGSSTAVISGTVTLMSGNDYTAIAIGDKVTGETAFDLLVLEDDNKLPAPDVFKLRLGHLAPFADTLADTMADVRTHDDTMTLLDDVVFGMVDDVYLKLDAGEYDLKITTPDGSKTLIDLPPITFTEGQILSAFAVGDGVNQPLGGYALPSDAMGFFITTELMYFFPLFFN